MHCSERVFPGTKDQFDLPPPGIQQNHLGGGQIPTIGQELEVVVADSKADQPKDRAARVATQFDGRVAQLGEEAVVSRQVRFDRTQFAVTEIASFPDDEECASGKAIQIELEIEVSAIKDVSHA